MKQENKDSIERYFVPITAQQVYDVYIKPNLSNPDYKLPESGAKMFYAIKHPEGFDIKALTHHTLDEDTCVSLIESVMDSEDFAGWPFGRDNVKELGL